MNFASLVLRHADTNPSRTALILPQEWDDSGATVSESIAYGPLGRRVAAFSRGFEKAGWIRGDRVVVMIPLSIDLYAFVLALMASGMTPVLIDAGMGVRKVLQAIDTAKPRAIVSVGALLKYRWVLPPLWPLQKYARDCSGFGLRPLGTLLATPDPSFSPVDCEDDEAALITFTSGTTGRPKGADRTHRLLTEQHLALDANFPSEPGEVDLPCFPVVALHDLACGNTAALPPVDLRQPADVNPKAVIAYARKIGATTLSGAPAYVSRIADELCESRQTLPSIRAVYVGGAPVSRKLASRVSEAFPDADCQIIYGSTEAEPIAHVSMDEATKAVGDGHIVGPAVEQVNLVLATLARGPIELGPNGLDEFRCPQGELGEVLVAGRHVVRRYVDDQVATAANKIFASDGTVWHRTGDLGRLDEHGRLWLTGRVDDAIQSRGRTLQPFPIEEQINALDGVVRSALVEHSGSDGGEVAIQTSPGSRKAAVVKRVEGLLTDLELGQLPVRTVKLIPVDRRHNSKIDRPALRKLLERRGA